MYKKDVQIAWNVLHLLNDDWQKTISLCLDINAKWKMDVTEDYLRKIIHNLSQHGFVETRKGRGVRRSMKRIIFMDEVLFAFGVDLSYTPNTPYGKIMRQVNDLVRRQEFNNSKILHRIDDE